tara:strand:+ start:287 stop:862 length:576 start_codon:yes stop_codon:yes gene_type:complete
MCPKSKPTETVLHRLELQTAERDALNALVTQAQAVSISQTVENATDSFSNVFKPFFGSGDEGLLLTFITAQLLDDLIVPDDTILDVFLSDDNQMKLISTGMGLAGFIASMISGFSQPGPPDMTATITSAWNKKDRMRVKWQNLTPEQKNDLKPKLMWLSKTLKTTKYITGTYLAAKVGADLLGGIGEIVPL